MWKLFKHLGEHKVTVLLIILLLIGQAYCDLALDVYKRQTFRYGKVNMGIRLGNITHGEFITLQMVHRYMKNHPDEHGIGVSELARCSYM